MSQIIGFILLLSVLLFLLVVAAAVLFVFFDSYLPSAVTRWVAFQFRRKHEELTLNEREFRLKAEQDRHALEVQLKLTKIANKQALHGVVRHGADERLTSINGGPRLNWHIPAQLSGTGQVPLLKSADSQPDASTIPPITELHTLLGDRSPSLERLIIGAYYNNGQISPLEVSLYDLVHVIVAGLTRGGKSFFVRALLWQIAVASPQTTFYLSDIGRVTFSGLDLDYVKTPQDTITLLEGLKNEMYHRAELFESLADKLSLNIDKLDTYNQHADEPLPPVVLVVDEATTLLNEYSETRSPLSELVRLAAKYGLYIIVLGQAFDHKIIPTHTRSQFGSRFQLVAENKTQANLLIKPDGGTGAESFGVGEAMVYLSRLREYRHVRLPSLDANELRGKILTMSLEGVTTTKPLTQFQQDLQLTLDRADEIRWRAGKPVTASVCDILSLPRGGADYPRAQAVAVWLVDNVKPTTSESLSMGDSVALDCE